MWYAHFCYVYYCRCYYDVLNISKHFSYINSPEWILGHVAVDQWCLNLSSFPRGIQYRWLRLHSVLSRLCSRYQCIWQDTSIDYHCPKSTGSVIIRVDMQYYSIHEVHKRKNAQKLKNIFSQCLKNNWYCLILKHYECQNSPYSIADYIKNSPKIVYKTFGMRSFGLICKHCGISFSLLYVHCRSCCVSL